MYYLLPLVPRQIDARLEWCWTKFSTPSLDLTGNFLVPQSPWVHRLRGKREISVLSTFRILPIQREQVISSISCIEPYILSCQGAKPFMDWVGSYDSLSPIRWLARIIIQRLKPLLYKDKGSKIYRRQANFRLRCPKISLGVAVS